MKITTKIYFPPFNSPLECDQRPCQVINRLPRYCPSPVLMRNRLSIQNGCLTCLITSKKYTCGINKRLSLQNGSEQMSWLFLNAVKRRTGDKPERKKSSEQQLFFPGRGRLKKILG